MRGCSGSGSGSIQPLAIRKAFNYTVGTITIDREGYVDVPDEQATDLKAFLIAKGWMEPEPEPEQPRIQIGVPAKDLTVANVTNLIYMRYLQYEGEKVLRQQANS